MSKQLKKDNFVVFLNNMRLKPKQFSYYYDAITHPSYKGENKYTSSYQKLEFLGDTIINAYVTIKIYRKFPKLSEGELTNLRSLIIKGETLAKYAHNIGIAKYIRTGAGAIQLKNNPKVLEDVFEALIAAIWLDQGEKKTIKILDRIIEKDIIEFAKTNTKNPKTILQEFLQSNIRKAVIYNVIKEGKNFIAEAISDGKIFGVGKGITKKEAEINAAKNALRKVKI